MLSALAAVAVATTPARGPVSLSDIAMRDVGYSAIVERGAHYEIWDRGDGRFTYRTGVGVWAVDEHGVARPWVWDGGVLRNGRVGVRTQGPTAWTDAAGRVVVGEEQWAVEVDGVAHPMRPLASSVHPSGPAAELIVLLGHDVVTARVSYRLPIGGPAKQSVSGTLGPAGVLRLVQTWRDVRFDTTRWHWRGSAPESLHGPNTVDVRRGPLEKVALLDDDRHVITLGAIVAGHTDLEQVRVDPAAGEVTFVWGPWTLSGDAEFELDPIVFTDASPTEDGFMVDGSGNETCDVNPSSTNRDSTSELMEVGPWDNGGAMSECDRAYIEWDISGIPDNATVTDTVFRYETRANLGSVDACDFVSMELQPTVATDAALWMDMADGTVFVDAWADCNAIGAGKSVDLGPAADADVESQLAADWFALGIKGNDETVNASPNWTRIASMDAVIAAMPAPTLEVTYSLPCTNPPTSPGAVATSFMDVDVTWSAPAGCTAIGYRIERESPVGGGFNVVIANTMSTSTSLPDTTLSSNTEYNYRISAFGEVGAASPASSEVHGDTLAIAVGLTATAVDDFNRLTWTNAPGAEETGYQIDRRPCAAGWTTLVFDTGTTALTYDDTAVVPGQCYGYRVAAINESGPGALSPESTANTNTTPSAPSALMAVATSPTEIMLGWMAPMSDGGDPVRGYRIERESPVGGGWFELVNDTMSAASAYADTTVVADTEYNYRVSAINDVGNSSPSAPASERTPVGGGMSCTLPSQCNPIFCADSMCCDTACDAPCQSCQTGTCSAVLNSNDPQCPGSCDAIGNCVLPAGSACMNNSQCQSGNCHDGFCCDVPCGGPCQGCAAPTGAGTCIPLVAGNPGSPPCTPQVCDGVAGACPGGCSTDASCVATHYCAAPVCVLKKPNGEPCTRPGECDTAACEDSVCGLADGSACITDGRCRSGFCVDGVCCNTRCAGEFASCAIEGAAGTCNPEGVDPVDPGGGCNCRTAPTPLFGLLILVLRRLLQSRRRRR